MGLNKPLGFASGFIQSLPRRLFSPTQLYSSPLEQWHSQSGISEGAKAVARLYRLRSDRFARSVARPQHGKYFPLQYTGSPGSVLMAVWVTYSIHWYCLKGAEVEHLLLTTCTYYIIAILVDIAKRTTADSAKCVSNAKAKKWGGPAPPPPPPGPPLATLLH